ncbi:hypothetical protein [Clostridium tertium]|uniref:hypothetical protein n=1 Tax=Clostridium tertium TaxID=1559 RepID=UPI0024B34AE0|nr:hypothetical protein [Clostridium tertium]MDI9216721.1 hypothetical protein [Clostridium tertium]
MKENLKSKLELKIKKVWILIVGILNIITSLCLNFNEFLMGGPVKFKNIIVSIVYILIWPAIILLANWLKSKKLLKIFLGFWILDLILIVLMIIISKLDIYIPLIIPFILLCFGPMYGLDKFSSVIRTIISIFSCVFIYYLIKRKNAK